MGIFQKLKKSVFSEEKKEVEKADMSLQKEAKKTSKKEKVQETGMAALKTKGEGSYQLSHKVILSARVSEKAAHMGSMHKYVFLVHPDANKSEVKKAIHHVFGVNPKHVNIINGTGKSVGIRRGKGKRSDYKKAIVTLSKKETISIYEGV